MADLKNLKVIIYDLDGVLINSAAANRAFYEHILAHFGLPPLTEDQWTAVKPLTSEAAIDWLFTNHPARLAAQAYQRTLDNRPFLPLLTVEPHLTAALSRLRPRYRTAIATNRGRSLPLILETLRLARFFDLTVSSLEVRRPKPHPECLIKILRHFQVKTEEACYIGDHEHDRQAAAAAGMPFGAYRHRELAADFHLADHLDLVALLEEANGGALDRGQA